MELSENTENQLKEIAKNNNIDFNKVHNEFKKFYSEVKEKAGSDEERLEMLAIRSLRCNDIDYSNVKKSEEVTYTRQEIYDVFIQRYCNGPKDYDYSEKGVKVLTGKYLNKYPKRYVKDNGKYPKGAIGSVFRRFQDTLKEGSIIQEDKMDWDELRRKVYNRDDYTCWECGEGDTEVHAHHIIPKFADGEDYSRNLITLCSDCHSNKHEWMNN